MQMSVPHAVAVNFLGKAPTWFKQASIYFMKGLLLDLFTKLLIKLKNKIALSIAFAASWVFLDALTVMPVIISVGLGFYSIYHKVVSGKDFHVCQQ
jgi:NhaB family Na+:H+ antiporter